MKNPSTALSNTTTLSSASFSIAVPISSSSGICLGPKILTGGKSKVTRQNVGRCFCRRTVCVVNFSGRFMANSFAGSDDQLVLMSSVCAFGAIQRWENAAHINVWAAEILASKSDSKMFAQLQALRLIVRADALAVHRIRSRQHFFVDQAADDLAVLEDERHLARAHFQHRAGALPAGAGIAEAGIEEAGIVHTEFANQGIERHHLGGIIRRHLDGFLGGENVEFAGVENETAVGPRGYRLPEFIDRIAAAAVDIDHAGVRLGAG